MSDERNEPERRSIERELWLDEHLVEWLDELDDADAVVNRILEREIAVEKWERLEQERERLEQEWERTHDEIKRIDDELIRLFESTTNPR